MHSGARGQSGSKKPLSKEAPNWVEYKGKEIEELIVQLANQGLPASEIGLMLRDQYGVPSVRAVAGKRVEEILGEHKLLGEVPEDLMALIRKSVKLKRHMEKNKRDYTSKRGYQLSVSKIRRLVFYYQKKGRLPENWRYTEENAELLVK